MYRDNTLIPSEAVRLLALGTLSMAETAYDSLANEVRSFTAHIAGPSLDIVGTPIELLKLEGLIEPVDDSDISDSALLRVTDAGRDELIRLLTSSIRAPVSDINKLIIAVKIRFLHLLNSSDQQMQIDMLTEVCERELVRLIELRSLHVEEAGYLTAWLDHDIDQTRARLDWFKELSDRVD